MTKHLLKLVWNRKRINFLITVEIFFSFIVLFGVVLAAVYYVDNYRQPLGFTYENVWCVTVEMNNRGGNARVSQNTKTEAGAPAAPVAEAEPAAAATFRQLMTAAKEFDEVEGVATSTVTPYGDSTNTSAVGDEPNVIRYGVNQVSDDYLQVLGLMLTRGRWFGKEDDGANYQPVVINERLSRDVFGELDPLGKDLKRPSFFPQKEESKDKPMRVVGVVSEFRKDGEYTAPENFLFQRQLLNHEMNGEPRSLMLKVRPGTTAEFEEKIIKRLQAVAKDGSFEIEPVAKMRETANTFRLAPLIAGGLIAGFLMLMVAMGLTGVLWQNVTQRTREIGLRRAKGATARRIHKQILAELLIIATIGLIVGVAAVVQFPLLDVIGNINSRVFSLSVLISLAVIYALTVICGLYPSWMATKVQPAEA
ncbi:MAG TPA: ABC transporter permease, partial [Blastocatellia bacterium]|nr:ABC transporter permease [Blastocatellia bacterium]